MGLFDSDVLEFDTDNLRAQANVIKELADQLEQAQKSLGDNLHSLQEDWKTAAGEEFLKKYDDKWVKQLDGHIQMLRSLVEALQIAINQYEPLVDEYSKITLTE